jgi:transcriptional regulator GlxA family with amidase domain
VAWVQEHLDNAITVDDMAAHAAMSARTFARRFRGDMGVPPHQWLTRQRVTKAQRLLETTDLPIDTIATSCGFGSAATLRHHFQREARTTPSAYRSSFAAR